MTIKKTITFRFIRKGIVGAWKEELSPDLISKLDAWIKRNEEKCPSSKKYDICQF